MTSRPRMKDELHRGDSNSGDIAFRPAAAARVRSRSSSPNHSAKVRFVAFHRQRLSHALCHLDELLDEVAQIAGDAEKHERGDCVLIAL